METLVKWNLTSLVRKKYKIEGHNDNSVEGIQQNGWGGILPFLHVDDHGRDTGFVGTV